jgi:O-antigen/teichoic acid export membrane protein
MNSKAATRRGLGLFGDVLASGALVGASAVVNLVSVMVFARSLDPVAFGLFATCRRVVAFAAPLASAGGHLGVSRYLGYYSGEAAQRRVALQTALGLMFAVSCTSALAFLGLYRFGRGIDWVSTLSESLWFATAALTATTAAGLVAFSVLRGLGQPRLANLQQLATLTALLVIAAIWRDAGVTRLLWASAVSGAVVNAVCLGGVVRRFPALWRTGDSAQSGHVVSQIMRYSVVRIADGPLQASLSLIGVIVAPAIGGLALAGYIHISQTIVRVTEIVVVPLSVIFLPVVARLAHDGRTRELRRHAQLVYESIVLVGACGVTHGVAWGQPLLDAAFGAKYAGALPYLLCTLPSILPFLLFAGFRSFIDGYSTRPMNTLHLGIASAFIVVATSVAGGFAYGLGLCLAYTAGVGLLGTLTVAYTRRHFGVRCLERHTATAALIAIAGGGVAWSVARLADGASPSRLFVVVAISEGFLAVGSIWLARRCRHPVVVYALQRWAERRRRPGAQRAGAPGVAAEALAPGPAPAPATEPAPTADAADAPDAPAAEALTR